MKPIKIPLGISLIFGGFIALFSLLHAQETATPVQSTAPDSIVQLTAEAQGLGLVSPDDLPELGTFWVVDTNGVSAPWPCPPRDANLPIYGVTDGQFLVDMTGGKVSTDGQTVQEALTAMATSVVNLIGQIQEPQASQTLTAGGGMRAMAMGVPSPDDGGDTNSYSGGALPDFASFNLLVTGANLWLEITNLANGTAGLLLSNTIADVQYEIQGVTNLENTNWISEGFVLGSELTNWTPTSVAATNQPTLFLRVRSWIDSDNIGIPDWWQLEYFGYVGVDPNSDPVGDGWTLLQDFQNGWNPNVFRTPPAPLGLTVSSFNASTSTATLTWLPSPSPVTGYTIQTPSGNFNISSNEFADSVSSLTASYQVRANYAGGDSAWSAPVSVPSDFPISLIAGLQTTAYLLVPSLPAGASKIRISRYDLFAEGSFNDYSFDRYFDLPITSITNGFCQIPAACVEGLADSYGYANYLWEAQILDTNSYALSQVANFGVGYGNAESTGPDWLVPPYFDGRQQLKQDLIFQLRAANTVTPFILNNFIPNGGGSVLVTYPPNYVYEGFYGINNENLIYGANPETSPEFDVFLPFEDNNMFRNYVYSTADVDSNGNMTTGVQQDSYDTNLVTSLPPTYQFQSPATNGITIPSLLATNNSRWLCLYPLTLNYADGAEPPIGFSMSLSGYTLQWILNNGVRNYWGLPFLSAEVYYVNTSNNSVNGVVNAGNSIYSISDGLPVYMEAAQPQFQTVAYDFWNIPAFDVLYYSTNLIPGMASFSTSRTSDLLITAVGNPNFQVAGYAKLAVTNSYYSGVYGYLGQYFTNAYVITNGIVTTNTTGVLSPYGRFFPTQPGPVALVTMPDLDTGARGTATVYCVSLQLDANHDGNMDLSFNGKDATSPSSPFVFWANNNYDRWTPDEDDGTNYMDDVQVQGCPAAPNTATPDCNYSNRLANGYCYRAIPCTRDLEDYARLWVCGITSNLLAALPSGSTITLNWGDVGSPNSTNPTIDLFTGADINGGIGYLTNETVATQQTNAIQCPYIGRLGPGQSIQLNTIQFANNWAGNYFIWCGVTNGSGQLNLTITDGNSNVLAQASQWIQIVDIKQMYERWTVVENPNKSPTNTAYLATDGLPVGASAFQYTQPQNTTTPYILLVHGWNMETWDKDRFAETAFKRVYWQGYQGRFGEFRWPTDFGFTGLWQIIATNSTEKDNFDGSEYQAWQSAQGLLNKLDDLNTQYPTHVYLLAHSMGNIVANEALRLSGSSEVVNTYVASQAAVTAHTYDTNVPNYSFVYYAYGIPLSLSADTPNIYRNWFVGNGDAAGAIVSFYNTNDYALQRSVWQLDQLLKPDHSVLESGTIWTYGYTGSVSDPAPWNNFYKQSTNSTLDFNIVTSLNNRHEVMAYAAQPYTTALGATPAVANLTKNVDLMGVWPGDPTGNNYTEHFWHSAEFRGDYPQQQNYWSELLGASAFNLK